MYMYMYMECGIDTKRGEERRREEKRTIGEREIRNIQ